MSGVWQGMKKGQGVVKQMEKYLDRTVCADERAQDLLSRMSLGEKMGQVVGVFPMTVDDLSWTAQHPYGVGNVSTLCTRSVRSAKEFVRFQTTFQKKIMESSPHHIPAFFHMEGLCGAYIYGAVSFPGGIGRASSWDPELEEQIGDCIGRCERAVGVSQTFAPVLDISRDSRMGRQGETYGEDSTLAAAMGTAYLKGLQKNERFDGLKTEGIAKHYMGFHAGMGGIHGAECDISKRSLMEVYAKPFQAAITEAGLRGVMPCYDAINGEEVSCSEEMLTTILRNEMGMDGIAVSDYSALSNAFYVDHVGESAGETGLFAMQAGMNMELPSMVCYNEGLEKMFEDGRADSGVLDARVLEILRTKFRTGLFDHPFACEDGQLHCEIRTEEDDRLTEQSALESLVLLKNDGTLPIRDSVKKIAVIGQHADDAKIFFGGYTYMSMLEGEVAARSSMAGIGEIAGENEAVKTYPGSSVQADNDAFRERLQTYMPQVKSLVEELRTRFPQTEITYAYGYPFAGNDESGYEEALRVCAESDLILLTLGGKYSMGSQATTGEGIDATNINLPVCQDRFIELAAALCKPMVGIHFDGRPISSDVADRCLNSILEAWSPAERGAFAVVSVLAGDYNPCGKMPVSTAYNSGQIPVFYNHRFGSANHQSYSIGFADYVDCPHTPRYCFGHGVSYTDFEYRELAIEKKRLSGKESLELTLQVKNCGERAGTEIVQFYVSDEHACVVRPNMELTGFARVRIEPGEIKKIRYVLPLSALAFLDLHNRWKIEKGDVILKVGSSSEDIRLSDRFTITDDTWIDGRTRAFYGTAECVV